MAAFGLVVVGVPASIPPVVQRGSLEAVFLPLAETADGTVGADALGQVLGALERADAVAIGPGLSRHDETEGFVRELVRGSPVPMVVDADGLNAFASRADDIADRKADAVMTPHEGEFARLTDQGAHELEADRLRAVRSLASRAGAVALLKGPRTLVSSPEGVVHVNATGGPVLATAGSGDVLTGVIGGLLARGSTPLASACVGAYLHGAAGSLAGRARGEGTLAGDIVSHLPAAMERVTEP